MGSSHEVALRRGKAMANNSVKFSVFTKPWKMELNELGKFVSGLGFDGIELPVRDEYQVPPDKVEQLPAAAKVLADYGVEICSIAGPTDERTIAACAEAGVPTIRVCVSVGEDGYLATEARVQKEYDELVPMLDSYGVRIGVQNHCNNCVANAVGTLRLIEKYDPKHVGAVWDPAHCALDGEIPEIAVDVLWSHLCMVNLKNGIWQRTNGPEAEVAEWQSYWTSGRQGLASWPRVAELLVKRGWEGVVCLCAEYSDHDEVERLIAEDMAFARPLFE